MAIGTPYLRSNGYATAATFTTGTPWTPTALAKLYGLVSVRENSNAPVKGSMADSEGLVWAEIADVVVASTNLRLTLYEATAEASPNSRTSTSNSTGAECIRQQVVEVTGAQIRSISGTPQKATAGHATALSVTPSLPAACDANSTALCFAACSIQSTFDALTGYTNLLNTNAGTTGAYVADLIAYDAGSPAQSASPYLGTAVPHLAILIELEDLYPGQPAVKRFGGVPGMALNPGTW